jgi:hypothetical protein
LGVRIVGLGNPILTRTAGYPPHGKGSLQRELCFQAALILCGGKSVSNSRPCRLFPTLVHKICGQPFKEHFMHRYTRRWDEERLLSVLAYRPFITVSHFAHEDKAKRRCAAAAKRRGLVVLEDSGTGYFTVRLAKQTATAYARRKYGVQAA